MALGSVCCRPSRPYSAPTMPRQRKSCRAKSMQTPTSGESALLIAKAAALNGELPGCNCYDNLKEPGRNSAKPCKHVLAHARTLKPLTSEQQQSVDEVLELALNGELNGCTCVATGEPMPCEHVYETALDPAIAVIREEERKARSSGLHVLRAAAYILEQSADSNPRKDNCRPSKMSTDPTEELPGTVEKRKVLEERVRKGESVFCPGDRLLKWVETLDLRDECDESEVNDDDGE